MSMPCLALDQIGREAQVLADDHLAIKLWLRLFACSTKIEQSMRKQLRNQFATTLARFDYLAQLERFPGGLRMAVLARYLMVSGGNVTTLTDQLLAEGLVDRQPDPHDRRSYIVKLTPKGLQTFLEMAAKHEEWLVTMLNDFEDKEVLYGVLGRLGLHLALHNPH